MLTDEQGKLIWRGIPLGWGSYGTQIGSYDRDDALWSHQSLALQGQYVDQETGLHYNLYRYYCPLTARFTQPDPIGLEGGINPYQYAPNALSWIDPLGLKCSTPTFDAQKKFKYKEGEMSVMKHILMGHRKSALQEGTSKFLTNSPKKIDGYIHEALAKGQVSENGKELIYAFSREIGTNVDGVPTKTIKLFMDAKGWVRTAFPL